ncbi:phage minor head protein [Wielerella bovis]|uniref:phage head morphogenesis protein n=1 Tax=Wielerella bovis TaxID=2917790 RepID=UPI002018CDE0|nr:phage minor head protein [Wielerella bovis]ULJ60784.1 phage head morphogenesis protein [Wielerella bovis]
MPKPFKKQQNEIILRPIRANLGVEATYRKQLKKLLKEMQADVQVCIEQHYPQGLAQDGLFDGLQLALSRLLKKWLKKLDIDAPTIAEAFLKQSLKHTDKAFQAALKAENFPVMNFHMDDNIKNAVQASLSANVGLIRSIGQQYLSRVEQDVWQSINAGHDLATLTKTLKDSYHISEKRAAFIARDQNNKAKAVIEQARRQSLGITEAIWVHSHAGKQPRASHLAANGKRFDIAKGMYLDGKWVQPATEINCRCASRAVIPAFQAA